MFRYLSKFALWVLGWDTTEAMPPGVRKAVITAGPHTSNWDFYIGRLAYAALGVKVKFLIKKEAFKWPLGGILKALGGIPVDRSRSNNLVDQVASMFKDVDSLFVVITPEGTRKPNPRWKKGFYYIALKADIPIALGYIDIQGRMCQEIDTLHDWKQIKNYVNKRGMSDEKSLYCDKC